MDIFVGSIPFKLKESELREIFEKFGEVVSVSIIINKATRLNKGFAFVQMADDQKAVKAIAALNNTEIMDRTIIVSQAEESKDAPKSKKAKGVRVKHEGTNTAVWKRKQFPKNKKKESVIDKHSDDLNKDKKKKRGGVKLAKNFKVGKRKKR
jgi:RNA recognition motif-containing protein